MTTTTTRPRSTRVSWILIAVAALVVAVGAATGWFSPGGRAGAMELSMGEGAALASCIQFDVEVLSQAPVAFEGTVLTAAGDAVSLNVDHWYRGGDADTVHLSAPQGMEALIGGFDFAAGDQYLITATDGTVNYCGFSGPATPQLRAAFDEAFGA